MQDELINQLRKGKVGVLPTDTLYGLVGSAMLKPVVERIYKLKQRDPDKPMIILVGSVDDLRIFNIHLGEGEARVVKQYWPGPVSIVLPCPDEKFLHLHRGGETLAFRLPDDSQLTELLKQTGPLVAPSANPEGEPVAEDIETAKRYFGDDVDFYIDGGTLTGQPSTVIELRDGKAVIRRQGR